MSVGIVAFVAVAPSPHFLGYALMGSIVAVAAALTPAAQDRTSQIG